MKKYTAKLIGRLTESVKAISYDHAQTGFRLQQSYEENARQAGRIRQLTDENEQLRMVVREGQEGNIELLEKNKELGDSNVELRIALKEEEARGNEREYVNADPLVPDTTVEFEEEEGDKLNPFSSATRDLPGTTKTAKFHELAEAAGMEIVKVDASEFHGFDDMVPAEVEIVENDKPCEGAYLRTE